MLSNVDTSSRTFLGNGESSDSEEVGDALFGTRRGGGTVCVCYAYNHSIHVHVY